MHWFGGAEPAIGFYPTRYAGLWTTYSNIAVFIRPIRPEDEPLMVDFNNTLS